MQLTRPQREVTRKQQHSAVVRRREQHRVLREAQVVADANADVAVLGRENGKLRSAWLDVFTLLEDDAARDVDVKKMQLSMLGLELTLPSEAQAGVVDFLAVGNALRDAAAD